MCQNLSILHASVAKFLNEFNRQNGLNLRNHWHIQPLPYFTLYFSHSPCIQPYTRAKGATALPFVGTPHAVGTPCTSLNPCRSSPTRVQFREDSFHKISLPYLVYFVSGLYQCVYAFNGFEEKRDDWHCSLWSFVDNL